MNGRDACNKDDFKRTHLVCSRSPVYPSTALLMKVFEKGLMETRVMESGR